MVKGRILIVHSCSVLSSQHKLWHSHTVLVQWLLRNIFQYLWTNTSSTGHDSSIWIILIISVNWCTNKSKKFNNNNCFNLAYGTPWWSRQCHCFEKTILLYILWIRLRFICSHTFRSLRRYVCAFPFHKSNYIAF